MIRDIFSTESLVAGWMMWWRSLVMSIPLIIIVGLLMYALNKIIGGGDRFINVSTQLIMLAVWIYIYHICGKMVVRKRYQKEVNVFIGWSICWRYFLTIVVLLIPAIIIGFLLGIILAPLAVLVIPLVAYLVIVAFGWSSRRVFELTAGVPM